MHIDRFKQEDDSYLDEIGVYWENPKQMLRSMLGFCGCGDPKSAMTHVRDVLESVKNHHKEGVDNSTQKTRDLFRTDGEYYFMLYWLDSKGFARHGGSVGGCWLTKNGKELLEDLTELLKESEEAENL